MAKSTEQKNVASTVKAGAKTGTTAKSLTSGSKVAKGKPAAKKAVAKAAPKAAKEASTEGRRGRAPAWPLETKIKVLVSENPKREGSASHARFSLYGKGTTVGQFLADGGYSADLHYDLDHEFISIG